jgi:hypothetical protein
MESADLFLGLLMYYSVGTLILFVLWFSGLAMSFRTGTDK